MSDISLSLEKQMYLVASQTGVNNGNVEEYRTNKKIIYETVYDKFYKYIFIILRLLTSYSIKRGGK